MSWLTLETKKWFSLFYFFFTPPPPPPPLTVIIITHTSMTKLHDVISSPTSYSRRTGFKWLFKDDIFLTIKQYISYCRPRSFNSILSYCKIYNLASVDSVSTQPDPIGLTNIRVTHKHDVPWTTDKLATVRWSIRTMGLRIIIMFFDGM
jgi:hypothetical protein